METTSDEGPVTNCTLRLFDPALVTLRFPTELEAPSGEGTRDGEVTFVHPCCRSIRPGLSSRDLRHAHGRQICGECSKRVASCNAGGGFVNWIFASPLGVAIVLLVVHSLFDGEAAGFRDQLVVSDRSRLRYPQGLFIRRASAQ